jgi:hypothetical protein
VRRRTSGGVLALAGAALACAAAPAALGASRTLTVEGWSPRVMAFSGDRLLWTEAATVRVDPAKIAGSPAGAQRFDYYRAEVFRAPLDRTSRRFTAEADTPVSVRTSIAAMDPGTLSPTGDGGFVMVPGSRRFAPPVIRCCTVDDVETVIESDGRPDAPVAVTATAAAGGARYLQLTPGGLATVRVYDPAVPGAPASLPTADSTAPGLVAITPDAVGWVDPAVPAAFVLQADGAATVGIALPGPALRVWGAPGLFAVAVRVGAGVTLLRVDEAPAPRAVRVWSGARVPRVALGGGAIAVADGHRVLASRRGPLRVAATSRRVVDAVGVDGRRLALIERATRRGQRVGVVRLGSVR